jgi:siderophore synthetase component
MKLAEVRRWARGQGIGAARVRRTYEAALLHVTSRVVQAIYRESGLLLPMPARLLPFRRLEVTALPAGVRTVPSLLATLRRSLKGTEYGRRFPALRHDIENSVANVVLNRLLGPKARSLEPAYQGHQYWPFPALRVGPSLEQVLACSHLTRKPVVLPLVEVDDCRLISARFGSHTAFQRAWSGLKGEALIPVHPWQLELSPVVRELLKTGSVRLSSHKVEMIPLASQRTCRILATGYDVKLPVDATLTGEHRLLYRLNLENAPLVSALAEELLRESGLRTLAFQPDVASVFHRQFGSHLGAIVRPPLKPRAGERLVPAINLWTGPHEGRALLRRVPVEKFFTRYCRALMEGPVAFYTEWGMAFEPHLQNVYVGLRDSLPTRIMLRDLDNSIIDPRRVRGRLRALGNPAKDTWRHMPPYPDGGRRMVQAMLYGHLGEVIWRLSEDHGADTGRLMAIVDHTWNELRAFGVQQLRGWSNSVKTTLRTRLRRATALRFVER